MGFLTNYKSTADFKIAKILNTLFSAYIVSTAALTIIFIAKSPLFSNINIGDFVAFKAAAHAAFDGSATPYDSATISKIINHINDTNKTYSIRYWRYPPHFFLFIDWMRFVSFHSGVLLWSTMNLIVFFYGIYELVDRDIRVIALLGAPSVGGVILMGQNGFFIAGLLAFALAHHKSRPILAGFAFGCLSIKPHLALAIPFYCVGLRAWVLAYSTIFSAISLLILSIIFYELSFWTDFFVVIWNSLTQNTGWFTEMAPRNVAVFVLVNQMFDSPTSLLLFGIISTCVLGAIIFVSGKCESRLSATLIVVGATTIISPKLMDYDAVIWLLPMALIAQRGLKSGFRLIEFGVIGAFWSALPIIRFSQAAVGFQVWSLVGIWLFFYGVYLAFKEGGHKNLNKCF